MIPLLICNSHNMKFTHLKYIIQRILVYSQSCTTIDLGSRRAGPAFLPAVPDGELSCSRGRVAGSVERRWRAPGAHAASGCAMPRWQGLQRPPESCGSVARLQLWLAPSVTTPAPGPQHLQALAAPQDEGDALWLAVAAGAGGEGIGPRWEA